MGVTLEMTYPCCRNFGYLFGVTGHLWNERGPRGTAIYCPACGKPSQSLWSKSADERRVEAENERDELQTRLDRSQRVIRSLRGYIAGRRRRELQRRREPRS